MGTTITPTGEDFLTQLQTRLNERIAQRASFKADLDGILNACAAENRTDLSADENTRFQELRSKIAKLDLTDPAAEGYGESIAALQARVAELAELDKRQYQTSQVVSVGAQNVRVKSEARTYNEHNDKRGTQFLRDVMNAQTRMDLGAAQRLERHMQEERVERAEYMRGIESRDVGTSAFAGLTVPQYLTQFVAPKIRNKRPFADICRHLDLPPQGMTVELSRVTTGTAVASQSSQAGAVQETDIDDTVLSVNVRTVAGQQDVARQVIDRTSGGDQVVIEDLIGAYHEELDRQLIAADGTGGTHLGIKNVSGNVGVTYTDASPTAAELHPKLADLLQQIASGVDQMTHFIFHPRRWWWLGSQLSSTFPLITVGGAGTQQAGQLGQPTVNPAGRVREYLEALVILDRNIETTLGGGTEDAIYGVNADECFLWEDESAPLLIRAEQSGAGNLMVKFVVYGYSAFTAGRYPLATGDITGTGLAAPTF